jgi:hypothetical protein
MTQCPCRDEAATPAAENSGQKENRPETQDETVIYAVGESAVKLEGLSKASEILREHGCKEVADVLERLTADCRLALQFNRGVPISRRDLYEAMLRLAKHAEWVSDLAKRVREPVQIGVLDFCRDQIEWQVALLVAQDQGLLTH